MKIGKMVKTAVVADKLLRLMQKVLLIAAIASAGILGALTVIAVLSPDRLAGAMATSIDIGPLTFEIARNAARDVGDVLTLDWLRIGYGVLFLLILYYALGEFRKILRPIAEERPFAPSVSKELRKVALACLALGLARYLTLFCEAANLIHVFDLASLLRGSQIQSVRANLRLDVTPLLVFLILMLVSYVFQYGEELQKLSDETL